MFNLKTVFIGDGCCGKTSAIMTYTDKFPELHVPTVFDNTSVQLMYDQRVINLSVWDTAGQSDYDPLRPLSYPGTDVVVMCFSLDSSTSLYNVTSKWHPEILNFLPTTPIILVGMKSDLLENKSRKIIEQKEIQAAMKLKNVKNYLECSALKDYRIKDLFNSIVKLALNLPEKTGKRHRCTIL